MFEGVQNVAEARLDGFSGIGDWHGNSGGKPSQGVGDTFSHGAPDVGAVAAVGVEGRADVPSI